MPRAGGYREACVRNMASPQEPSPCRRLDHQRRWNSFCRGGVGADRRLRPKRRAAALKVLTARGEGHEYRQRVAVLVGVEFAATSVAVERWLLSAELEPIVAEVVSLREECAGQLGPQALEAPQDTRENDVRQRMALAVEVDAVRVALDAP